MTVPELGPLYEPEAVGFSFLSPGWYILAALLLLFALYSSIKWLRMYIKNAYRREALKSLLSIEAGLGQEEETTSLRSTLVLLKNVAINTFGRENVAALYGRDWLIFLEEKGSETPFQEYSPSISAALYRSEKPETEQVREIISLSKRWIKTHA
ncbi:MAG: DUF4381 domain-containing protein [Bacteroides sp.]|nr:DUF4381 domain-containing protein [Bacteroides sp.]